ncbi:MAG: hypothetical protein ACREBC_29950, partial [Pyrinomonadaceae bacterium]
QECSAPMGAVFYDTPTIVYVREDMDFVADKFAQSILFHEYIHVLQHLRNPNLSYECEARQEREFEALHHQKLYAAKLGVDPMKLMGMELHYREMCG